MKIGTKSLLFGSHQFLIHPWFVAAAWWKLYGFPSDWRLWVCFFAHDLGYWGKPNMDGEEGETHPELGARIVHRLCDDPRAIAVDCWCLPDVFDCPCCDQAKKHWYYFTLYHSRFYAKRDGAPVSQLCVADKFAITLTPAWWYLRVARASGELREYMRLAARNIHAEPDRFDYGQPSDRVAWYRALQEFMRKWVAEHKLGGIDSWMPTNDQKRPA